MYGWRGRIGLIVPSSNTTCEMEFHRMSPEGVSVHTARVFNPEITEESEKEKAMLQMSGELTRAAREVASVQPGVIIYACTTASFIKGPGYDLELGDKIKRETGIPGFSTTTAVVEALKALGLKQIALATPYAQSIGEKETQFFEMGIPGMKVVAEKHLGYVPNIPKGKLAPESAYLTAREIDRPEADGIFISCTNWRTIEIIEQLEADTGKPVVTSNQASLWMALKMIGVAGPEGYGKLFLK
ncbi:MAG: aspartate/glutamate racemase family protein [Deltaproteobacteria bacterium]|nr:aspartate/glutamate racemase family protein [Deltaproteobacteria bacterium]